MRRLLLTLIGPLALVAHASGLEVEAVQDVDFEVFRTGTPEAVAAAIPKLPKPTGLETRNKFGETPLLLAALSNRSAEVLSVLLKAGAELEARNVLGFTPLMHAASYNRSAEVVSVLLKAGAELEARTEDGLTPLTYAARYGESEEVLLALLEAGANAKVKDKDGKRPLDYAKENEKLYKTKAYWKLNDATFN
jgi:hypothetical protein